MNELQNIPNVDKLLADPAISESTPYREEALSAVRDVLDGLRKRLLDGKIDKVPQHDEIIKNVVELIHKRAGRGLKRVINASGVILHSNLGRACLSVAAKEAVTLAASGYTTLEYDIEKGKRGSRIGIIEERLQKITSCEGAVVVNNNAAAMLLILCATAYNGNVIVSRGELVEIGGGFRVPEILEQCGCTLREVGTTNKTRISDYAGAIDNDTSAILKIHSSNFKIMGFTESVTIKELSELSTKREIPLIEDIGSGALVDMKRYGVNDEPLAALSLKDGADIVSFSGDKLLGGPQCGIILGRDKYISAMKKHPLYRALRIDKLAIAALEATLRAYSDLAAAEQEIPVLAMLSAPKDELRNSAEKLCEKIKQLGGNAQVVPTKSTVGGGSVPGLELDSYAVMPISHLSASKLDATLHAEPVPIIGRIEKDRLLLDVRTMFASDFDSIAEVIANVSTSLAPTTNYKQEIVFSSPNP